MKKAAVLILALALFISGCGAEKSVTYQGGGFTITLNDEFTYAQNESMALMLESQNAMFAVAQDKFSDLLEIGITASSSAGDYANVVMSANELSGAVKERNGYAYFTYENTSQDIDFYYFAVVYKGKDGFWFGNFACRQEDKAKYEKKFLNWADTASYE